MSGSSCRSIVAGDTETTSESLITIYEQFHKEKVPVIIPDTSKYDSDHLYGAFSDKPYRSIIIAPLIFNDELLGVLELISNTKGSLDAAVYAKLNEIIPMLTIAINRSRDEFQNKVQSVIKENYTSIHPTVEWKFTEAAFRLLSKQEQGESPIPEEITLKDVHPLFAVSDIKNSSTARNDAISNDLIHQLKLAKHVMQIGKKEVEYPLISELVYGINKTISKLKKGLLSGDEVNVVNFLHTEVEPMIKTLEKDISEFHRISAKYWSALDDTIQLVYNRRKDYESSLNSINEAISTCLEKEQERAQEMFPHFFEAYKTDGVEYNMYIGQSITNERKYNHLYLKNLKLWQILVTAEIARITYNIKKTLPLPLETTHLILVHNQSLSVKFKMDEKRFDVDGAYNMRYEIVKKRIDKVKIKDTEERLTQPGKIAIVYSHLQDASEYKDYLEYLRHKGLIETQIEDLELEDLQGVSGLRALRVSVVMDSKSIDRELKKLAETSTVS